MYLVCKQCKKYYKLEEGEKVEDFESCQCGGELVASHAPAKTVKSLEEKEEKHRLAMISSNKYLIFVIISLAVFCVNVHGFPNFQRTKV